MCRGRPSRSAASPADGGRSRTLAVDEPFRPPLQPNRLVTRWIRNRTRTDRLTETSQRERRLDPH